MAAGLTILRSENLSRPNEPHICEGDHEEIGGGDREPTILFIGSGQGWHARGVLRAFLDRGLNPVVAPLDSCAFSSENPLGFDIPGLDGRLPDAVFVRMVPGGTFEQVTFFLGVLHALRDHGVRVWNDARAIENCTDKSTTTYLMQRAGLAVPKTWCGVGQEQAEALASEAEREGWVLVQKPLFGSQGRGLRLVRSPSDLAPAEETGGVYYLQEFVGEEGTTAKDWRVFVCRDKVLASMIRHGEGWITNVRQGGRAEAAIPSEELKDIAIRAAAAVGAHYAGVDVLQDQDGKYLVLEVNSMPAWSALERVSKVPVADLVVDAFLEDTLTGVGRKWAGQSVKWARLQAAGE